VVIDDSMMLTTQAKERNDDESENNAVIITKNLRNASNCSQSESESHRECVDYEAIIEVFEMRGLIARLINCFTFAQMLMEAYSRESVRWHT
jgi:hypothetical protein